MSRILRREAARRDLVAIVAHFLDAGSPASARRFREQAEAALSRLANRPGLGTRFETLPPAFGEIRYLPLPSRFKKYLVFYRPLPEGIEVVRVLHGARDVAGILALDLLDDQSDDETE